MQKYDKYVIGWKKNLSGSSCLSQRCTEVIIELNSFAQDVQPYLSLKLLQIIHELSDLIFETECVEVSELIILIREVVLNSKKHNFFSSFMQMLLKIIWNLLKSNRYKIVDELLQNLIFNRDEIYIDYLPTIAKSTKYIIRFISNQKHYKHAGKLLQNYSLSLQIVPNSTSLYFILDEMFDIAGLGMNQFLDVFKEKSIVFLKNTIDIVLKNANLIGDSELWFLLFTKILVIIFRFDKKFDQTNISESFLTATSLTNVIQTNPNSKYGYQLLTLAFAALIANEKNNLNHFNMLCDISSKFFNNNRSCPIVQDTAVTMSQLIAIKSNQVIPHLNGYESSKCFAFCNLLIPILEGCTFKKKFTTCCPDLRAHEIESLLSVTTTVFKHIVDEKYVKQNLIKNFVTLTTYRLSLLRKLNCPYQHTYLIYAVSQIAKAISKLEREYAEYGVELGEQLLKLSYDENINCLSSLNLLQKCYKLLSLPIQFEESRAFYFAQMLHEGNRKELLQRMLFSAFYDDFATSVSLVDVLKKNNFMFKGLLFNNVDVVDLMRLEIEVVHQHSSRAKFKFQLIIQLFKSTNEFLKTAEVIYFTDHLSLEALNTILHEIEKREIKTEDKIKLCCIQGSILFVKYISSHLKAKQKLTSLLKLSENVYNWIVVLGEPEIQLEFERSSILYLDAALAQFQLFYEFVSTHNERDHWQFELNHAIELCEKIARHFTIHHYLTKAFLSWCLVYRLAKLNNNDLAIINAIAFMAVNPSYYKSSEMDAKTLNDLVDECKRILGNYLKTKSSKNIQKSKYIYLAVCSISIYFASIGQLAIANICLQTVKDYVEGLKQDNNGKEVIICMFCYTYLVVATKNNLLTNMSPFLNAETVLEYVKTIKTLNMEDVYHLSYVVFNLVDLLSHSGIARYDIRHLTPFLTMNLAFAVKQGLAIRAIHIAITFGSVYHILQKSEEAKIQLSIIDAIFGLNQIYEFSSDPIIIKPVFEGKRKIIDRYITRHHANCICNICFDCRLPLLLLTVGCLTARVCFFENQPNWAIEFHSKAIRFIKKCTYIFDMSEDINFFILYLLIGCCHNLRCIQQNDTSLDVLTVPSNLVSMLNDTAITQDWSFHKYQWHLVLDVKDQNWKLNLLSKLFLDNPPKSH